MAIDDLNLLKDFEALWLERSVSKAGKRLGLGQPAMSARLNKLREALQDQVFVRHPSGLTPTPQAIEWAPMILAAMESCRMITRTPNEFVPKQAIGKVVIAGTDYFDVLAMPVLIPRVVKEAPKVQIVTQTIARDFPKNQLENGCLDLAVAGFFRELPEGFYKQTIFKESFVCAARKDHPVVSSRLSKKGYLSVSHLLISPQGDLDGTVDQVLARQGLQRNVVAGVGNFHAPGQIVANSDLVLTGPRRLLLSYAQHLPLQIFEPPFEIPPFSVVQIWHERTHRDPLRSWIRKLIQETANRVWAHQ